MRVVAMQGTSHESKMLHLLIAYMHTLAFSPSAERLHAADRQRRPLAAVAVR